MVLELVQTDNVIRTYPGRQPAGKYDRFDKAAGRLRSLEIRDDIRASNLKMVIIAGRTAATALQVPVLEYFQPTFCTLYDTTMVIIPHPGGTNRWWNSEDNRRLVRQELPRLFGVHAYA